MVVLKKIKRKGEESDERKKNNESGSYYGYATYFTGNKTKYSGVTYYNPVYVIQNNRLP